MSLLLKKEAWTPEEGEELSKEELKHAVSELVKRDTLYRKIERDFIDPNIANQQIAVISFAALNEPIIKTDENGIEKKLYGFMKVRGVFANDLDATKFSKKLIKHFDSKNVCHHIRVGHPFPIATNLFGEREYITVNEQLEEVEKALKLKQDEKELEEKQYFEKRKDELFKDVETPMNSVDRYIILREKYCTMGLYYEEYSKQLKNIEKIGQKAYNQIRELETTNPEVLMKYEEKYRETRKRCGLDKDKSEESIKIQQYFNTLPIFSFIKK